GVYVPTSAAPDSPPAGGGRVLAFLPDARTTEDLEPLADADELVGFVDRPFTRLNPAHREIVKSLAGADGNRCWVVRVREPSWLKGLGFTLGSLVIPGVFAAWRLRRPLHDD